MTSQTMHEDYASLISVLGLRFVDKLALCYYAHRIIEEHFNCDLTDILRTTMAFVVNRHKARLDGEPSTGQTATNVKG